MKSSPFEVSPSKSKAPPSKSSFCEKLNLLLSYLPPWQVIDPDESRVYRLPVSTIRRVDLRPIDRETNLQWLTLRSTQESTRPGSKSTVDRVQNLLALGRLYSLRKRPIRSVDFAVYARIYPARQCLRTPLPSRLPPKYLPGYPVSSPPFGLPSELASMVLYRSSRNS